MYTEKLGNNSVDFIISIYLSYICITPSTVYIMIVVRMENKLIGKSKVLYVLIVTTIFFLGKVYIVEGKIKTIVSLSYKSGLYLFFFLLV